MKGLDLSKFKKTSEDGHSTTLTHDDGHEIRLAHWGLSAKLKGDLSKLPMTQAKSKFKKMADGGMVAEPDPDKARAMTSTLKPTESDKAITNAVKHPIDTIRSAIGFAKGGDVKADDQLLDPNSYGLNAPVPDNSQWVQQPQSTPPMPMGSPSQPQPEPQSAMPPSSVAQAPTDDWSGSAGSIPPQGSTQVGDWSGSVGQMPATTPDQQQQQAAPATGGQAPTPQQQQQPPADPKTSTMQELQQHQMDFEHDLMNGHIQPETYSSLFDKKDTLGKIGTIFGMILGGAGSGLTGGPNVAMQMMDKEIERDLEAQKSSASNKQNLFKLNLEQQMNQANVNRMGHENQLTDAQAKSATAEAKAKAYALTRTQMNAAALHKLTVQAQQLPAGSPQRQQAEQQLGMLYQAVQGQNFNIMDQAASASAYYKTLMGMGTGQGGDSEQQFQSQLNAMRMMGPAGDARAKELEQRHLPGVQGQSSVPIPEKDREHWQHLNNLDASYNDAQQFLNKFKGIGPVNPSDRAQGKALGNRLELEIGQLEGLGRFTPEEAKRYKSMIPDLSGTHFTDSDAKKLQGLQREVAEHRSNLLSGNGLRAPQQQQQAAETKTMNGVHYQKVPGGWKRVQ